MIHYGHAVGDTVLVENYRCYAQYRCVKAILSGDLGGEEFGIYLPWRQHANRPIEIV